MQDEASSSQDSKEVLDDMLRRINFSAEVFYRGQLCDFWALDTSGTGHVNFHIVYLGDCWLHLPFTPTPTLLSAGDIVVFPNDSPHIIGSSQDRPTNFGVQTITRQIPLEATHPGTALICGFLAIDQSVRRFLLTALPEFIVISANTGESHKPIQTLLELLFFEAKIEGVGVSAILDRLADALLFYVIREVIAKNVPVAGLLGVFRDPQIAKAVLAINNSMGKQWTVELLAEKAHLSRSVFSERFYKACGMAPIEFLTIWRMYYAKYWLEKDRISVMEVAERCGYESPAAFSKAFKRILGIGPGQYRKIGINTKQFN
jgi:AraC-like DNA-binding protein